MSELSHSYLPDDIQGWTRSTAPSHYNRETIFDYIDGAGEVYLSYGFQGVLVARYERQDLPGLAVEIFDMGKPEDAYGVFSYSRDTEAEGIGGGYQFLGSLLTFWQSRYFVCVQTDSLTERTRPVVEQMARSIAEKLPSGAERPRLLGVLPSPGRVACSERFLHTHPSLNYHYYLAEQNVLNLDSTTNCVLARYAGQTYLLIVEYASTEQATAAGESFVHAYAPELAASDVTPTENGKFLGIDRLGRYLTIVLDAGSEAAAREQLQAATTLLPNLDVR